MDVQLVRSFVVRPTLRTMLLVPLFLSIQVAGLSMRMPTTRWTSKPDHAVAFYDEDRACAWSVVKSLGQAWYTVDHEGIKWSGGVPVIGFAFGTAPMQAIRSGRLPSSVAKSARHEPLKPISSIVAVGWPFPFLLSTRVVARQSATVKDTVSVRPFWRGDITVDGVSLFKSLVTVLGAILLIDVALRSMLWSLRVRGRRCATCGYDLRHNRYGRCPECGHGCNSPRARS